MIETIYWIVVFVMIAGAGIFFWVEKVVRLCELLSKKLKHEPIGRTETITWYRPEEKQPPEKTLVVATLSGQDEDITYDHVLFFAYYTDKGGWNLGDMEGFTIEEWAQIDTGVNK